MSLQKYLFLGASALSMACPTVAFAQSEEPAANTRSDPNEIIVSATRRDESLLEVPLSIAAYSQEKLDEKGILDISALARITPGLTVSENGFSGNKFIAIRGLSSSVGATMTGLYFDDTPIQVRNLVLQTNFYPALYDLERVEVLRGPQGTLFGAGAMAGAVRFIQAKPSVTEYSGNARAELAFTENGEPSYEVSGAYGGPIVQDVLGFRASVNYRRDGGYVDRVPLFPTRGTGEKDENSNRALAINAALTFKPTEDITITPSLFLQDNNIDGTSLQWRLGNGATRPQLPRYQSGDGIASTKIDKSRIYSLKAQWDVGPVSLISNTSMIDRKTRTVDDGTGLYLDIFGPLLGIGDASQADLGGLENAVINVNLRQKSFAQEFRIQSNDPGSRLQYVLGAFYQNSRQSHDDTDFAPNAGGTYLFLIPTGPNGQFVDTVDAIRDRQMAVFGQVDWEVLDGLTVTAGLRYSEVKFNSRTVSRDPALPADPPLVVTGGATDRPLTPKFGIQYEVNDNLMFYASASKGFRAGGINTFRDTTNSCTDDLADINRTSVPNSYKSDSLWNYEIGAKGRISNLATFAASAYRIQWDDIQRTRILPRCAGTFTDNFGKARSQGFEAQITLTPARGLSFDLALGYVDATQQETLQPFINLPGDPRQFNTTLRKGDRFSLPWTVSTAVDYETPLSGNVRAYGHAQYDYKAGYGVAPGNIGFNPVLGTFDDQHYVSARVGVRFDSMDLSAFVNNLTNSYDYLGQIHFQPSERIIYVTQRPRTWGATARYRF